MNWNFYMVLLALIPAAALGAVAGKLFTHYRTERELDHFIEQVEEYKRTEAAHPEPAAAKVVERHVPEWINMERRTGGTKR